MRTHAEGEGRIEGYLNKELIDHNHETFSDRDSGRKYGYKNGCREKYGFRIEKIDEEALPK